MNFDYKIGDLSLNVTLKNKKNIKHCYLRIISKNEIEIKANIYFSKYDALGLIEDKKNWISKQLLNFRNKTVLKDNEFLYFGKIFNKEKEEIRDLDMFYRKKINKILPNIVFKYSKIMKLFPTMIKYRKNKKTWGSCNYKNELNFNIYLCKFPIEVMEYVVIHELAHIKHKNHSKQFWHLVKEYCPDYKEREKVLKSFL